jgi:hypothetical protein
MLHSALAAQLVPVIGQLVEVLARVVYRAAEASDGARHWTRCTHLQPQTVRDSWSRSGRNVTLGA